MGQAPRFRYGNTGKEDHDQMIQIAWGLYDGHNDLVLSKSFKCMPTIEWHSEWHEDHNLTMDDIRGHPPLDTAMIQPFLDDVADADYVLAYNADFDLRLVERELRRLGIDSSIISKKPFIDPYAVWKKCEGQKLIHAYKRWTGKELKDAHDAEADATAAVAILPGMLTEFGLDGITCKELASLSREPDDVDRTGKMKWVDKKPVLTCTKYNYYGDGTGTNVPGLNVWEVTRVNQWYANNYHGFKTVHRSVLVAFQLALRYINDEQGFIDAMIEEFGPPPAEDDEVNVQPSPEAPIDNSMQQAIEQQRLEQEHAMRQAYEEQQRADHETMQESPHEQNLGNQEPEDIPPHDCMDHIEMSFEVYGDGENFDTYELAWCGICDADLTEVVQQMYNDWEPDEDDYRYEA